jgi:hypothetical protein
LDFGGFFGSFSVDEIPSAGTDSLCRVQIPSADAFPGFGHEEESKAWIG